MVPTLLKSLTYTLQRLEEQIQNLHTRLDLFNAMAESARKFRARFFKQSTNKK